MEIDISQLSPMMQHYMETKKEYPDCILFYRLGDFYEMFFDDALAASKALEITLTGKECGLKERAPMCGVPYHAVDSYLYRLVQKGFKVAIAEQMEDPKQAKGLVKREVTRIVTPGTNLDTMAAATLAGAQADAMKTAAGNAGGAMTGFMGMNMAGMTGGFNAQNLYAMGQQQAAQAQQMAQPQPNPAVSQAQAGGSAPATDQWKCSCGAMVSGNFCPECGAKKPQTPAANASWTCSCGAVNTGKFCTNCGSPKPAMKPRYRCDKCGWEPEDPTNPPKFCPNCGDPFNENDTQ